MRIDFLKPEIFEEDIAVASDIIRSGWLVYGDVTRRAERELANLFGSEDFVMTSSCTASLQIALMLSNIGIGDEVITTPMTWVATSNVIVHQGATPVFVDVDPTTGIIDFQKLKSAITKRTKAVIIVDLYGLMPNYQELRKQINNEDITIIEDAAHSIGSECNTRLPGQDADYACFSFHAAKNITSGQGGGIICRNFEDYALARLIRREGVSGANNERVMHVLGHKFDGTEFQSALLMRQILNYRSISDRRRAVYKNYCDLFDGLSGVQFQRVPENYSGIHSGHMFVLWIEPASKRNSLIEYLISKGIGVSVHYNPVHLEPYYRQNFGYKEGDFPFAEKIGAGAISLPTYPSLTKEEQIYIYDCVKNGLEN